MASTRIVHDEQRIQQVILNLQSNALKFTDKGFVKILGTISDKDGDSYLQISVIDTGAGIKVEDQDKLFKMFGYISDSN